MSVEIEDIKYFIETGIESEALAQWRESNPQKSSEVIARTRKFYKERDTFSISDADKADMWSVISKDEIYLKAINRKRRRLTRRLTTSIAVASAILCISFMIFNEYGDKSVIAQAEVIENKSKGIKIVAPVIDNAITLTTSNGELFIPKEEVTEVDFSIDGEEPLTKRMELINEINDESMLEEIAMNTINVPKGMFFKTTLPDGTIIYINNASSLEFPSRFKSNQPREVYLTGEAYFNVAKSETQEFIVHANNMAVKVYGTEFNVNTNKADQIDVVLVKGKVSAQISEGEEYMMNPNDMISYNTANETISQSVVDVNNYVSWIDGIYRFNVQYLHVILETLSLWYDTEFVFDCEETRKLEYICNIPRYKTIDEALDILSEAGSIAYSKISNQKIKIWRIE